jgi:hypothetical protein
VKRPSKTLPFLITFGVVRVITYSIRYQRIRVFHNVTDEGGLHIHDLVPGIIMVLVSGYLGLVLTKSPPTALVDIVFGVGAALVLDEFAPWLCLADVNWEACPWPWQCGSGSSFVQRGLRSTRPLGD